MHAATLPVGVGGGSESAVVVESDDEDSQAQGGGWHRTLGPTIVLSPPSPPSLVLVDNSPRHNHYSSPEMIPADLPAVASVHNPANNVLQPEASAIQPIAQAASSDDFAIPDLLQQGTPMTKVSPKKMQRVAFRLDADQGQITWTTKKPHISTSSSRASANAAVHGQVHDTRARLSYSIYSYSCIRIPSHAD